MMKLDNIVKQIEQYSQPPVHLWRPDVVGEVDIHIDAQGVWYHEGSIIERKQLVKLFSSILWYENQQYYLVTPVEKMAIKVADTPFIIEKADLVTSGSSSAWVVTSNVQEPIIIGLDCPVELRLYGVAKTQQQWLPYVRVRYDLWARVNRNVYYQWVEHAMQYASDGAQVLRLNSNGYEFSVAR